MFRCCTKFCDRSDSVPHEEERIYMTLINLDNFSVEESFIGYSPGLYILYSEHIVAM